MTVITSINLKEILVHHEDTETVNVSYGDNESLSLLTYEWSGATIVINVKNTNNHSQSISGCPIYLDGTYKGESNSNGQITLSNIAYGSHTLTTYTGNNLDPATDEYFGNMSITVDKLSDTVIFYVSVNEE